MKVISYRSITKDSGRQKLKDYLDTQQLKKLVIDYYRKEDKFFKTVSFNVYVKAINTENESFEIISLGIHDRVWIIDMIVFTRKLCEERSIEFVNKFEKDGYFYRNGKIYRIIEKPTKL